MNRSREPRRRALTGGARDPRAVAGDPPTTTLTRRSLAQLSTMLPASRRKRHSGRVLHPASAFTFVEMLAAMAFLGVLIPVVVSALMLSNRAAGVAERSTVAMQLGENRLDELMLADGWSSAGARGEFGEDWPGYRWELKEADWNSGAMTELTMDVFFQVQGREHSVQLSTLVNSSLSAP